MSTIGKDATEAQQVREHYQEREKRLREEQRKEIQKLSEAHKTEVNQIKQNHDVSKQGANKEAQESIQRRDMRHQREMDSIRKMHAEQKKRASIERTHNEDHLVDVYEDRLTQQEKRYESQLESQRLGNRGQLQKKDIQTAQTIEGYRDRVVQTTKEENERQNRRTAREKKEQNIRHNDQLYRMSRDQERFRAGKNHELGQLKSKYDHELASQERRQKILVEDLKYNHAEDLDNVRGEHKHSVQKVQQRYDKALKREQEQLAETRDKYFSEHGRDFKERDHLNQKIRRLRNDNVRDRYRADSQKRREIDNIQASHRHAYDKLYEERQGMVEEFNRINHEEIREAQLNANERIKANMDSNAKKVEEAETRNTRQLTDQRKDLITENNDRRAVNELHLNQIKDDYSVDRKKLLISHKNEKQRLRDRYALNLDETRHKDKVEREDLRRRFEEKISEMDIKHANEIAKLKRDNEIQLVDMRDRQQQQIVDLKKENDRLKFEREITYKAKDKNKDLKYESRLENIEKEHAKQLSRRDNLYKQNLRDLIHEGQRIEKQKA